MRVSFITNYEHISIFLKSSISCYKKQVISKWDYSDRFFLLISLTVYQQKKIPKKKKKITFLFLFLLLIFSFNNCKEDFRWMLQFSLCT